jgi:2-hydroxychromene-2-carboxylate isomerase
MCPYAYQTSRWIRAVRTQTPLDITWRFFSLEEVNLVAGKRHPWERPWSYGFGQMRVGALIRRELGNDALDRWYETVGRAFFYDGVKTHVPDTHGEVIANAGFDPALVERAIADPSTLDEVREEHQDAVAHYGAHGVPTIVFDSGYAVYGPVVVPAPEADDALALWELVRSMQRFPRLYELRHPKTTDDVLHVAEQFRTYLTTRDWNTVENPAP